jgi:hypothetical protein
MFTLRLDALVQAARGHDTHFTGEVAQKVR